MFHILYSKTHQPGYSTGNGEYFYDLTLYENVQPVGSVDGTFWPNRQRPTQPQRIFGC
jgi:hypothetical protein